MLIRGICYIHAKLYLDPFSRCCMIEQTNKPNNTNNTAPYLTKLARKLALSYDLVEKSMP